LAFASLVRFIKHFLLVCLAMFTAFAAVGLTAPADAPFAISVRTTFLRVEPSSTGQPRPRALGLDVDVKFGAAHVHLGWPGFLLAAISTPHLDQPV
jgi:hypothetical protein